MEIKKKSKKSMHLTYQQIEILKEFLNKNIY